MATLLTPTETFEAFCAAQQLADAVLPAHRLRAVLAAAGSPEAVVGLSDADLTRPEVGLTVKQIGRLRDSLRQAVPAKMLERAAQLGVSIITYQDPSYPVNLFPYDDAPPMLFVRGALRPEDRSAIGIVGSRRATLYGRGQAARFTRAFVEAGLTVVSGGAAGIDTAAHREALSAGGRTVAILGCGADVTYPAENRALFEEITARGAVLSEFAFGTKPEPWRFPTRNRIIAGMSRAVLVVEAPKDSGALITARNAAEYGLDVWAVPGAVDIGRSQGCHRLIQDGAFLADSPEDIIEALNLTRNQTLELPFDPPVVLESSPAPSVPKAPSLPPVTPPRAVPLPPLSPSEETILKAFGSDPRHMDEAVAESGLGTGEALAAVTLLEMKKLLRRHPGNLFTRVA